MHEGTENNRNVAMRKKSSNNYKAIIVWRIFSPFCLYFLLLFKKTLHINHSVPSFPFFFSVTSSHTTLIHSLEGSQQNVAYQFEAGPNPFLLSRMSKEEFKDLLCKINYSVLLSSYNLDFSYCME